MNKNKWLGAVFDGTNKKPLPILSYPGAELIGASVRGLVTDAQLQARAMKAVADRCDASAAVTVMDLSVEAECFGAKVRFSENAVPEINEPLLTSPEQVQSLEIPPVGAGRTGIFIDAVKRAKELITDRPVLAGAAAPFSLAGRLADVTEIMYWCFDEPEAVKVLTEKCADFIVDYIRALKAAGADGVILAEPVAGLLSPAMEEEFSAPFIKKVADEVGSDDFITVYHNCGQGVIGMTDSIYSNGCDAYHFGNASDMEALLKAAPADKLVMGNIDPVACFRDGTPENMTACVKALLEKCGAYKNFLLSSGCDIPPEAKWENIGAFFSAPAKYCGG